MYTPDFHHTPVLQRRGFVAGLGAGLLGLTSWPRVWAQPVRGAAGLNGGRLVVVFLRGAYDGLSAWVPYADRDYLRLRPNIAIAAPDGSPLTAILLDSTFALHPALSALLPLWQQGVLACVPAAGLPLPNRSHFDAQYQMETAQSSLGSSTGWLNRLAGLGTGDALGVGEANPAILAGPAPVKLIARGQAAERTGVLANARSRQALNDLYAGSDKISQAFRQGANSRMQSAQTLSAEKSTNQAQALMGADATSAPARPSEHDGAAATPPGQAAQMLAASNGAQDPVGLQLDAQHLGTLMRSDRSLRLGFVSAGGWDTHANQGAASGPLANNLANLARGIVQLRQDFSQPGDVLLVLSEFGRTAAENGSRGTDHGFGNALWLLGNGVVGGRWHGEWTGLANGNLNQGRDLPAHHDYRAVLAQVLRHTWGLSDSQLGHVLPGVNWDSRLEGLMRKG